MSKFVIVKKAPENPGKHELVLTDANFLSEIALTAAKAPKKQQTSVNHMREVVTTILSKYEVPGADVFRIPFARYEGRAFANNHDLNDIFVELLKKEVPSVFEKVLEYNIKNRPYGTKLIYYVGELVDTGPFFRNGLDMLEPDEVENYLSGKPKKVVGKPAVTKAEAAE
jgi:hypothetical protein